MLSSRNGPYHVLGLDDFARPDSLCKFYATCQWDKYLPDALVGDRLAILNPYSGLTWVDFSGPVPKTGAREKRGEQPAGAQVNGICAFGDRYLYTMDDRYQFVMPDGSKTELRALPPVPEFQKTNRPRFTGIPRSDGRLVALTNRSGARYAVYDFADPQNPKRGSAFGSSRPGGVLERSCHHSGRPPGAAAFRTPVRRRSEAPSCPEKLLVKKAGM